MSKRPPGGPDSRQQYSEDIAGYKHAAYGMDHGDDAAGSDEGESRAAKRARGRGPPRRAVRKSADDKLPTIYYKDAGALKELGKMYEKSGPGACIQVRIPAHNLQATFAEVKGRHVWGTDVYTDDSDIVCAVMHCGYFNASLKKPVASVAEMKVVIQILPPQIEYPVFVRNGIRSRAWWAGGTNCSYKVERCSLLSKSGTVLELPPRSDRTRELIPTFTPANLERVMNTRGREASSERRQRQVKEMTLIYNLCNEPWPKYNMAAVADRGLKPSQWTSARFQTQVLLMETGRTRYELSMASDPDMENGDGQGEVVYRFARCKQPLAMRSMYKCGLPLPESHVDVLEPTLRWEELKWGEEGVDVKDKHYCLVRLHFVNKGAPQIDSPQTPSVSMEGMGDTGIALLNGRV
ncbi:hypothetical protein ABBQ32_004635 [Trebouxia sp. C0010 RCD-2024]